MTIADDFGPGDFSGVPVIAGMVPWMCSYTKDGARFAITLYGTNPRQVLEDNCEQLQNLCVDGQVMAISSSVRKGRSE